MLFGNWNFLVVMFIGHSGFSKFITIMSSNGLIVSAPCPHMLTSHFSQINRGKQDYTPRVLTFTLAWIIIPLLAFKILSRLDIPPNLLTIRFFHIYYYSIVIFDVNDCTHLYSPLSCLLHSSSLLEVRTRCITELSTNFTSNTMFTLVN